MNNKRQSLFALALTALGLFVAPKPANAFSLTPLPGFTDAEFEASISSGDFKELFVAQSRIGNNAISGDNPLSGDTEIDLLKAVYSTQSPPFSRTLPPVGTSQFAFTRGQPVDFSLEYNGSEVKYTVGGQLLSSNSFSGSFTDIFLRTRAQNYTTNPDGTRNSLLSNSILLSNLVLNGTPIGSLGSSSTSVKTDADIDYLRISDLPKTFKLTGQSTLSFHSSDRNSVPRGAQLAYQIKAGTTGVSSDEVTKSVPEPATLAGLGLVAGAMAVSRRRKG